MFKSTFSKENFSIWSAANRYMKVCTFLYPQPFVINSEWTLRKIPSKFDLKYSPWYFLTALIGTTTIFSISKLVKELVSNDRDNEFDATAAGLFLLFSAGFLM